MLFQLPCKTQFHCVHKQLWKANQLQCSSNKSRCDNIVHKECSFIRQEQAFPPVRFIASMDCPINKCLSTANKLNAVTSQTKYKFGDKEPRDMGGKKKRKKKKKLHGLSPQANYTDRATAVCRRSNCQLLRIEGATWSA
jgi:hypothetical protein